MRVINIVGYSNSGKTTLIAKLVPMLAKIGSVATIKHMGHHIFELPEGKDTTIHYEAGATCGCGIDQEKSVLSLRTTDIFMILDIYNFLGYDYCIVEGYKEEGFACVTLGDHDSENTLLCNPTVEELYEHRDVFPIYHPAHGRKSA